MNTTKQTEMKTQQTQTPGWDTSKSPFHAQAHSPLPWTVDYSGPARLSINDGTDQSIMLGNLQCEDGDTDEANAAFIVRACNNAERLADALRDCLINDPKHFTPAMNAALAQWEGSKQ